MEALDEVVAFAAENSGLEILQSLTDPLAAGLVDPTLTVGAPGIRPGIAGVLVGPEKSDPFARQPARDNVLANHGLRLKSVGLALNRRHVCL
jgi:hypothetical protein